MWLNLHLLNTWCVVYAPSWPHHQIPADTDSAMSHLYCYRQCLLPCLQEILNTERCKFGSLPLCHHYCILVLIDTFVSQIDHTQLNIWNNIHYLITSYFGFYKSPNIEFNITSSFQRGTWWVETYKTNLIYTFFLKSEFSFPSLFDRLSLLLII